MHRMIAQLSKPKNECNALYKQCKTVKGTSPLLSFSSAVSELSPLPYQFRTGLPKYPHMYGINKNIHLVRVCECVCVCVLASMPVCVCMCVFACPHLQVYELGFPYAACQTFSTQQTFEHIDKIPSIHNIVSQSHPNKYSAHKHTSNSYKHKYGSQFQACPANVT